MPAKWECTHCTTKNQILKMKCLICGAKKDGQLPNNVLKQQNKLLSQIRPSSAQTPKASPPKSRALSNSQNKIYMSNIKLDNLEKESKTPPLSPVKLQNKPADGCNSNSPSIKLHSPQSSLTHLNDKSESCTSTNVTDNNTENEIIMPHLDNKKIESICLQSCAFDMNTDSSENNILHNEDDQSVRENTSDLTKAEMLDKPMIVQKGKDLNLTEESTIFSSFFSTGAGKPVSITKEKLLQAKKKLEVQSSDSELSLFKKADGSAVRVSRSGLENAEKIVSGENKIEETAQGVKLTPESYRNGGILNDTEDKMKQQPVIPSNTRSSHSRTSGGSLHCATKINSATTVVGANVTRPNSMVLFRSRGDGSGGRFIAPRALHNPDTIANNQKKIIYSKQDQSTLLNETTNLFCPSEGDVNKISFTHSAKPLHDSPFPNSAMHFFPDCVEFQFPVTAVLVDPLVADVFGINGTPSEGYLTAEAFQMALRRLDANPKGCTIKWVENGLAHSAWMFAHTRPMTDHHFYTPATALSDLILRYNEEFSLGNRSILRKICEKDVPSTTRMLLYMTSIGGPNDIATKPVQLPFKSSGFQAHSGSSGKATVTDGFYSISVVLDAPLMHLTDERTLMEGSMIDVWGATSATVNPGHPLELAASTIILNLGYNGTKVLSQAEAVDKQCGVVEITPQNFPSLSIKKIHPVGGVVPSIIGVVSRVLPTQFQETVQNFSGNESMNAGGKSDPNASYRAPKIIRNTLAEEKRLDDVARAKEAEFEKLVSENGRTTEMIDGRPSRTHPSDPAEVAADLEEKYRHDVSAISTIIVEEDSGDVAVVQQWLRGTSCSFDELHQNLPKEGTRIRLYNLYPAKNFRPSPPFNGKTLYARPTFSFLPEPLKIEPPPEDRQMFAFERKIYTNLEKFEGAMKNIMVDICCIAIATEKVPSNVVNQSLTSYIFCCTSRNVFGSLESRTTPNFHLIFPQVLPGTVFMMQNVIFTSFDCTSGSNTVVRFAANEYSKFVLRHTTPDITNAFKEIEEVKLSLEPTISLGKKLIRNEEREKSNSRVSIGGDSVSSKCTAVDECCFLLKQPQGSSPMAFSPTFISPKDFYDHLSGCSDIRGPNYMSLSSSSVGARTSVGTPSRNLFERNINNGGRSHLSIYNHDDVPLKVPIDLLGKEPNPIDLREKYYNTSWYTSSKHTQGNRLSTNSELSSSCGTRQTITCPSNITLLETADIQQQYDNSTAQLSPKEVQGSPYSSDVALNSQPLSSTNNKYSKINRHKFVNFIPNSFQIDVHCGPERQITHKIMSVGHLRSLSMHFGPPPKDSDEVRQREEETIQSFQSIERSHVMTHGVNITLHCAFTDGLQEYSAQVKGIEETAKMLCSVVGPFSAIAASIVSDDWFHLSIRRREVLSLKDTFCEITKWKSFLIQSVIVNRDILSLCVDGESQSSLNFTELGKMKHWNQAIFPDSSNILWWLPEEFEEIQQRIDLAFSDHLIKVTVDFINENSDLEVLLIGCIPIREKCPIGELMRENTF